MWPIPRSLRAALLAGRNLLLSAALLGVLQLACAAAPHVNTTPEKTSDITKEVITRFIDEQHIPDVHQVEILDVTLDDVRFTNHDHPINLVLFTVKYGAPNDCQSGCFFSSGEGIYRGGDRVGWLQFEGEERGPGSWWDRFWRRFYSGDNGDLYLETTWKGLDIAQKSYLHPLHDWLAHSARVPAEVRQRYLGYLNGR
jgi:hypothetical protein